MKSLTIGAIAAGALAVGVFAYAQTMHSWTGGVPGPASLMQGGHMWQMGPGWMGQGPIARHHFAMMSGIPEPYSSMTNPLPHTQATLDQGAKVFVDNCAACHGKQGQGDGPAGANLTPPPGNLAWLSQMSMGQWDPFIYWTVAEGGSQFGSAMPAFKERLTKNQIWAVTAYIQAHLPQKSK